MTTLAALLRPEDRPGSHNGSAISKMMPPPALVRTGGSQQALRRTVCALEEYSGRRFIFILRKLT
jgi:hypothetical protein